MPESGASERGCRPGRRAHACRQDRWSMALLRGLACTPTSALLLAPCPRPASTADLTIERPNSDPVEPRLNPVSFTPLHSPNQHLSSKPRAPRASPRRDVPARASSWRGSARGASTRPSPRKSGCASSLVASSASVMMLLKKTSV
eukprot:353169-Chlamydomonas_euryale.AAC.7